MSSDTAKKTTKTVTTAEGRTFETKTTPLKPARVFLHLFLATLGVLWMVPLLVSLYASFRPFSETINKGFLSAPDSFSLENYRAALDQGDFIDKYWNTALILIPSLILTLFLASLIAFAASRFSWRFNIFFLVLFTAGNLLPQQIIVAPLFQAFRRIPLPEFMSNSGNLNGSNWAIILLHVGFQSGFCTFVLSNYMKLLPKELNEAAMVDGASLWTQYWHIIMPLTRPALAALATLEFAWIYNDFFWAVIFEQRGDDRPITSALSNLGGEFVTDTNVVSAASIFVIIPVMIVYFALQKHFIAGLTLGANKG
ncbi:MAG: carbohydrate ABC transporter permease [Acidimicrobiales bacterium]|nr:carbohydrate ABC transporter permease [Acidimicrobiales bacterium]